MLATIPAALMRLVAPKRTPCGLSRKIWPFEVSEPKILLGSSPVTRLSVIELLSGSLKLTLAPEPMSNDCQLITALLVD